MNLWNHNEEIHLQQALGPGAYGGMQVVMTISQGKVVWDGAKLQVERGAGRLIRRQAHGLLFHGLDTHRKAEVQSCGPVPVKRTSAGHSSKEEL